MISCPIPSSLLNCCLALASETTVESDTAVSVAESLNTENEEKGPANSTPVQDAVEAISAASSKIRYAFGYVDLTALLLNFLINDIWISG